MPPDTFSPSLPITPTQSWTQDSTGTLDDVQQEQQSEGPEGLIVFEKKWIVTEDGDDSASYFLYIELFLSLRPVSSGEFCSRYAADVHFQFSLKRCHCGLSVPEWSR
jgi:hypothetical protein